MRTIVCAVVLVSLYPKTSTVATGPTWANGAIPISVECSRSEPPVSQRIPSPDKLIALELRCRQASLKARYLDQRDCKALEVEPEFNMSGLAWSRGAAGIIVMAEIPCSGTYGGIGCQVRGYELEVPTGRILQRMSPRDLKRRYQSRMAWPMKIPDPPQYRSSVRGR
jgi:hypothetical protein